MRNLKNSVASAIGLALLAIAGAVQAGELKLSTVRIDLNDRQSNVALMVTNVGTTPSLVQFRAMNWRQAEQRDTLTPTREVMANPPIAEIAPGAQQLVRVGYNGKLQVQDERSYRLLIEEVPKKDRERVQAIETYLRISIPVFVAALDTAPRKLTPSIGTGENGAPVLVLRNAGNNHVRLTGYSLSDIAGAAGSGHKGLYYVLPGATMSLPIADAGVKPDRLARVDLATDSGTLQLPLAAR